MYEPIAIIGYGTLYPPNADSPEKFWENIKKGIEGINEVSEEIWDTDVFYDKNEKEEDKT